jgi:hypothetical protein
MSIHRNTSTRFISVCLAFALLFQGSLIKAAEQESTAALQDVQLREGGVLTTRVVDALGNPVAGEHVTIEYKGKPIASSVSDSDGLVAIRGLRPGLHAIVTPMSTTACRFWNEGSAPPSAVSLPAVVCDADVVRGQFGAFNLPMIVYGAVSLAALILAVDNYRDVEDLEDRVKALETASP